MKNALLFTCSPRKNSNSSALAASFLDGLASKGHRAETIDATKVKVHPCVACDRCWSRGRPCVIEDDMVAIHESLRRADLIVFAMPLYFYSWPAQIKPVLDRLYPYTDSAADYRLGGKAAALIVSGADRMESAFLPLRDSFRLSMAVAGATPIGELLATGLSSEGDAERLQLWPERAWEFGASF